MYIYPVKQFPLKSSTNYPAMMSRCTKARVFLLSATSPGCRTPKSHGFGRSQVSGYKRCSRILTEDITRVNSVNWLTTILVYAQPKIYSLDILAVYSIFRQFIQYSGSLFNIQAVYSISRQFIQYSGRFFNIEAVYSIFRQFIQLEFQSLFNWNFNLVTYLLNL